MIYSLMVKLRVLWNAYYSGMNHISEGFSITEDFSEQSKVPFLLVRDDFPATFGLNIVAGRNFVTGSIKAI